ncbi:DNA repair protein RadA [Candidatus Woesebacteria bacterium]|nr:DNA repair protein RadA [Candidatus Woesebacteria bacterium]MBP9687334.1 DNA repair protein RadA [Candidatus Woesebacteria bacterium]
MKLKSQYVCQQCGYVSAKWAGKCPSCDTWGSLVESVEVASSSKSSRRSDMPHATVVPLSEISTKMGARVTTGIPELDRVLSGGIVDGQVILLAGEPGIGKSTILLQLANTFKHILYVAGEESSSQIKLRAERLGIPSEHVIILEQTDIDVAVSVVQNKEYQWDLVIVDSIQTMTTSDLTGTAGSVGQVRESAFRITQAVKHAGVPAILVGQVTKEGTVAGPATLAHLVDTVLWFEGDVNRAIRMIRALKNRFGSTDEVGVFEMEEHGLASLSELAVRFLSERVSGVPGSAITVVLEGSRPLLVEIQALLVPTKLPMPRRVAQGIDAKRVDVILAILTKHCRLNLASYDCFVNVIGGITIRETGADLAIALAVASSVKNQALPDSLIALGELGLLGEIRTTAREKDRLKEAKRAGYSKFVASSNTKSISESVLRYFSLKGKTED